VCVDWYQKPFSTTLIHPHPHPHTLSHHPRRSHRWQLRPSTRGARRLALAIFRPSHTAPKRTPSTRTPSAFKDSVGPDAMPAAAVHGQSPAIARASPVNPSASPVAGPAGSNGVVSSATAEAPLPAMRRAVSAPAAPHSRLPGLASVSVSVSVSHCHPLSRQHSAPREPSHNHPPPTPPPHAHVSGPASKRRRGHPVRLPPSLRRVVPLLRSVLARHRRVSRRRALDPLAARRCVCLCVCVCVCVCVCECVRE
jgi:hypothetical protein